MFNQPIKPMLLQPSPTVIMKSGWLHSIKWDGFRIIIHYNRGFIRAFTRHGTEVTRSFPELQQIKLNCKSAILDGECVCFENQKSLRTCWDDVMTRFNIHKASEVNKAMNEMPAHFIVWDIIYIDGQDLTKEPLVVRLDVLTKNINSSDIISVSTTFTDGEGLFRKVKELGIEGICSKNPNSKYIFDIRSENMWVKTKAYQYDVFQVSAIRKSKFGWVLTKKNQYVGLIEYPPSKTVCKLFYKYAKEAIINETSEWKYIQPVFNCKVKFQSYTKKGLLRSPTFIEFV